MRHLKFALQPHTRAVTHTRTYLSGREKCSRKLAGCAREHFDEHSKPTKGFPVQNNFPATVGQVTRGTSLTCKTCVTQPLNMTSSDAETEVMN
jgi:hypothetical protein